VLIIVQFRADLNSRGTVRTRGERCISIIRTTTGKENMEPPEAQYELGKRVTIVGMGANLVLVAVKIGAGLEAKSQALIADGVHSVSDLFSDAVVLLGLRWGRRSEDEDHPFGHRRIETLASFIVGMMLCAAAVAMALSAGRDILHGKHAQPGVLALVIAAASVVAKEALYRYTIAVGRRIDSPALVSNAWHHRSDALSSIAVCVGVAGARLDPDWRILDAWAAIVVSALIVKVGISLVISSLKELVDTAPDQHVVDMINRCARKVKGVENTHDVRARTSGGKVFVEVHVEVDGELTVREGHDVAKAVERCLIDEVPRMEKAIIHVDPVDKGKPA
jgi:cation diffusion facilitator family transporter